jgi:hypothetical protein
MNNTQEIQEWQKEFDDEFNISDIGDDVEICFLKSELKSFISQKLKEKEERHKAELQTILSKVQEDVNFGAERGQMVQTKAQAYLLTILSKYE